MSPACEAAYLDLENFLEAPGDAIEPRHYRACLLALLGRRAQAQAEFIDLLDRAPRHFGVLNDFGTFLFSSGRRQAAVLALREAVTWHPDNPLAHTNLGCLYVGEGKMEEARRHFETALALDPANPMAHEGLRTVLTRSGDDASARTHRVRIARKPGRLAPFARTGDPIKVLLVESVIGGNIFAHAFLDDPAFEKTHVFLEHAGGGFPLPPHDLIFNAIGDPERCANLLEAAPAILAHSLAPVVNPPEAVRRTTRCEVARRLSALDGVVVPRIFSLPRERLTGPDAGETVAATGLRYPVLLRSPGFHTGEYFVRIDSADELPKAAAGLPGRSLLLIEFLDVRDGDGKIRKYRAMLVDGKILPLHVAISEHWKVHYFTADMPQNARHRSEDEAFLRDMAGVLGKRALAALRRIRDVLALDCAGVDFAFDARGRLVVFEANATMIVPEPEEDERWRYRLAHVQRVYDAVREMLVRRAVPALTSNDR
jgi:glutathione synthase/RimK-type ligase-like ATP-grasp enzyme